MRDKCRFSKKSKKSVLGHIENITGSVGNFVKCISQCMHWILDNCYQMNIIFISGNAEIIFLTLFCADFDQNPEEVILVHHYDLFLPNFGGHDSTADSSKTKQANVRFFCISIVCFFYTLN